MESEIKKLINVNISIITSLCYCYFISSKIPSGNFRLITLLPVIILFTLLPLHFSYLFPKAITSLFISWLANFKLIIFAFGQPPLSPPHATSLLHFISVAILPTKIKINQNKNNPSPQKPITRFSLILPAKVLIFSILAATHDWYKHHLHHTLVLLAYCLTVYLLVDAIFGACNVLVHAILHLELEPPSDDPYFSTSLQDFWGRRWNLMVTNLLRYTVYTPLRSRSSPLLAILATFLVSGLMHELLFYHITRASPTWEVTCFFVLHGLCLAVEIGLKMWLNGQWQLHWVVSGPLTVVFVVVTAMWLFFPPLIRAGATDAAVEECKMMLKFLKGVIEV